MCPTFHCVTCTWEQYSFLYNIMWCTFNLIVHASWWHSRRKYERLFYQHMKDTKFHPTYFKQWYGTFSIFIFFPSIISKSQARFIISHAPSVKTKFRLSCTNQWIQYPIYYNIKQYKWYSLTSSILYYRPIITVVVLSC